MKAMSLPCVYIVKEVDFKQSLKRGARVTFQVTESKKYFFKNDDGTHDSYTKKAFEEQEGIVLGKTFIDKIPYLYLMSSEKVDASDQALHIVPLKDVVLAESGHAIDASKFDYTPEIHGQGKTHNCCPAAAYNFLRVIDADRNFKIADDLQDSEKSLIYYQNMVNDFGLEAMALQKGEEGLAQGQKIMKHFKRFHLDLETQNKKEVFLSQLTGGKSFLLRVAIDAQPALVKSINVHNQEDADVAEVFALGSSEDRVSLLAQEQSRLTSKGEPSLGNFRYLLNNLTPGGVNWHYLLAIGIVDDGIHKGKVILMDSRREGIFRLEDFDKLVDSIQFAYTTKN